jgi:hypothetical protein
MRFFSSKEETQPSMLLVLNKEGNMDIIPSLPYIEKPEQMDAIAKSYAFMVATCYKREAMPYLQTSIANYGVKTGNEKFSNLILIYLNSLLNPADAPNDDDPMISPENAFRVRNNQE